MEEAFLSDPEGWGWLLSDKHRRMVAARWLLNIPPGFTSPSFCRRQTDPSPGASWAPGSSVGAGTGQGLGKHVKEVLRITPNWQEGQDWGGKPTLY